MKIIKIAAAFFLVCTFEASFNEALSCQTCDSNESCEKPETKSCDSYFTQAMSLSTDWVCYQGVDEHLVPTKRCYNRNYDPDKLVIEKCGKPGETLCLTCDDKDECNDVSPLKCYKCEDQPNCRRQLKIYCKQGEVCLSKITKAGERVKDCADDDACKHADTDRCETCQKDFCNDGTPKPRANKASMTFPFLTTPILMLACLTFLT